MSIQLHTYVEQRLNRWRAWYLSGRDPKPARVISSWGPCILNRNVEQVGRERPVHVDQSEAMETDAAVDALPQELRATVHEVYLRPGTMQQHAWALRCHRDTVYDRLYKANAKLLGYMNDLAAGIALPTPDRDIKNSLTRSDKKPNIPATVA